MNIRDTIVADRKLRVKSAGYNEGVAIPEKRDVPLVPFLKDPGVICEIKRRSPSKGKINADLKAVDQAGIYVRNGIKTISVLTEQKYFGGTLTDLISIKKLFPEVAVLRKDFLFSPEDISVSYRAGADAVLLIASVLSTEELTLMFNKAKALGMACLVEVHDEADVNKAAAICPDFTGINSRDLTTFTVDPVIPVKVKSLISWKTSVVFESGIFGYEDALFAGSGGFSGILVGEGVVRAPEKIPEIIQGLADGKTSPAPFWTKLFGKKSAGPLVKICGINRTEDAELASTGADILGFIFAKSPRRTTASLVRSCADLDVLKVAVVVHHPEDEALQDEVKALLEDGALDAVQFHGDEQPGQCRHLAYPYYKALQLKQNEDVNRINDFSCPRVLVDAFSSSVRGGTGKVLSEDIALSAGKKRALWLAGGLGPDNISNILDALHPELVDASSRLESAPGIKDADFLKEYFNRIDDYRKRNRYE